MFFFIGNLMLGSVISVLAADPMVDCPASETGCVNPNTTFFTSSNITGSAVANPDVEAFYDSQFPVGEGPNGTGTGPPNATGTGFIEDFTSYFEQFDFLSQVGELFRFVTFINPLFTFDVMEEMFAAIGIPQEQGDPSWTAMMTSFKLIFFALGIISIIFAIFKIDVI